MLKIKFYVNQKAQAMTLSGHAGAAAFGKDLICAAASMLVCTGAQSLLQLHKEGVLQQTPRVVLSPGAAQLEIFESCPAAEAVFFTLRTGCSLLASKYPKYVHLELTGEEMK